MSQIKKMMYSGEGRRYWGSVGNHTACSQGLSGTLLVKVATILIVLALTPLTQALTSTTTEPTATITITMTETETPTETEVPTTTTAEIDTTTPHDCGNGGSWVGVHCDCKSDSYLQNSTCHLCSDQIEFCTECSSNNGQINCTDCLPNYNLQNNQCSKIPPCAIESNNFGICVGVPVGVGVPILAGLVVGVVLFVRRRKRNKAPRTPRPQERKMSILPHPVEIDQARINEINNRQEDSVRSNQYYNPARDMEESMPAGRAPPVPTPTSLLPPDSQEHYDNFEVIKNSPRNQKKNQKRTVPRSDSHESLPDYENTKEELRELEKRRLDQGIRNPGQPGIHNPTQGGSNYHGPSRVPNVPSNKSLKQDVPLEHEVTDGPPPPSAIGHTTKKHPYVNLASLPDQSASPDAHKHAYVNIAQQQAKAELRKQSAHSSRSNKVESMFPEGLDNQGYGEPALHKSDSQNGQPMELTRELTYANVRAQRYS